MVDFLGIGNRIKKYREENRMTQLELAEKINVREKDIIQWENAEKQITIDNLDNISIVLNINIGILIHGEKFNAIDVEEPLAINETLEIFNNVNTENRKLLYDIAKKIKKDDTKN